MNRAVFLILGSLCLSACGPDSADVSPAARPVQEEQVSTSSPVPKPAISGRDVYLDNCASCHETGLNDAPVAGNRADWLNRSPLWQAVLLEHARSGYLEMPQKGGHPELSDEAVNAAAEYMLAITFPDRLPDQQ